MARGDHVCCNRFGYTHHGIDLGDGTVIHYSGEPGKKTNSIVRQTPIRVFARGSVPQIRSYARCDPLDVTIERACSRLGERKYDLLSNNCEHFAVWCKTGRGQSEQVKDATTSVGGAIGTGSAVAVGLGTVSATGAVTGLSGPGIMSGLAAIGGTAVGGIAVTGFLPGVITTGAMLHVLKDDPVLQPAEREARRVGRVATVLGAAGGSVTSIGAVAATGTVGLSATGISSGLAGIGGVVGGGMVSGVLITAAAPACLAAIVGYGAYRAWKRFHNSWVKAGVRQPTS